VTTLTFTRPSTISAVQFTPLGNYGAAVPVLITLSSGAGTGTIAPNGVDWCWVARDVGVDGVTRAVAVPASGTVAFESLTTVDPSTFLPAAVNAGAAALAASIATSATFVANRPVNLWDLGGDPTGAIDVTTLLTATGGRRIDIPPGVYKTSSAGVSIIPPANTSWQCERGVTFLAAATIHDKGMVWVQQPKFAITGQLTLDANSLSYHALQVDTGADGFSGSGITVTNSNHFGIQCGPQGGTAGITDITFDHLRIINCGSNANPTSGGMFTAKTTRLKINEAHVEGSHQQGFYLGAYGGGIDAQLSNITAINNGAIGLDVRIPGSTVVNVIAHGNKQAGFAVQYSDVTPTDITLVNITSFNNLVPSGGGGTAEIILSASDRLTALGLSTYSNLAAGVGVNKSLYLNTARTRVIGSSFVSETGGPTRNVVITPTSSNISFTGCRFELPGTGNIYNMDANGVDGLKVTTSSFTCGGTYNITLNGAVSNSDFRFGNTFSSALGSRIRVDGLTSGSGYFPAAAPAAFAGTDATVGNQLIADLRAAGFYS
jgi:hypothetical protein